LETAGKNKETVEWISDMINRNPFSVLRSRSMQ